MCFPNYTHCPKNVAKDTLDIDPRRMDMFALDDLTQWAVHHDGCGGSYVTRLINNTCPETHVRCHNAYCIPSYTLNNNLKDCPIFHSNDEPQENTTCPGHYNCYKSFICLHSDYVCDGIYQCPHKDDEKYCFLADICPDACACEGFAFTCTQMIPPQKYPFVTYLDIHGVDIVNDPQIEVLYKMRYLLFLNVSYCSLSNLTLYHTYSIMILDLSYNKLNSMASIDLTHIKRLRHLNLAGNVGIASIFSPLHDYLCNYGVHLQHLSLSNTGMNIRVQDTFKCNKTVLRFESLDLSFNDIEVNKQFFAGISLKLIDIAMSDKMLCCIFYNQYPTSRAKCKSPEDGLSSCDNLLASNFLRVCLWLLAVASLLGNGSVIIFRMFFESRTTSLGFHTFVMSLSISDLLMGVYLMIIGAADLAYKGEFKWKRWVWKRHPMCTTAGVLGLVSNEVSAFTICLIMLDRLMAIKFPLRRELQFTWKSALVVMTLVWLVGLLIAFIPLLPFYHHWEFFRQNSICLPLPITRQDFPGQSYATSVFLVLNFTLFVIIGLGQIVIYHAMRQSSKLTSTATSKDVVIARRLFVVVFSDFCCWFPVGVMGLMANAGVPIPGEVNVWTAIFVLPLNSALNPFLYTFSKWRQKRQVETEEKRHRAFVKRYNAENKV